MFLYSLIRGLNRVGICAEHNFLISSEKYREWSYGYRRIIMRFLAYFVYPLFLAFSCVFYRRGSVFIVTTNPFFAPLVAILCANKSKSVIHLVWDIFPEALIVSGRISERSFLTKILRMNANYIFRKSKANVFIGEELSRYVSTKIPNSAENFVIPVGCDAEPFERSPPKIIIPGQSIQLLYCGNVGLMHDIDTLLKVIISPVLFGQLNPDICFRFNAYGPLYEIFKREIRFRGHLQIPFQLILEGSLSNDDWVECMKICQVAIVTMLPGAEHVVVPSKTYSALAAGQAILAICPLDSDLARLVLENDCGWVIEPGDSQYLVDILNIISFDYALLHQKRINAFRVGQAKYSELCIANDWAKLIGIVTK